MLQQTKALIADQEIVRSWLGKINENDDAVIFETIDAMRTDSGYRAWIVTYAKKGLTTI